MALRHSHYEVGYTGVFSSWLASLALSKGFLGGRKYEIFHTPDIERHVLYNVHTRVLACRTISWHQH